MIPVRATSDRLVLAGQAKRWPRPVLRQESALPPDNPKLGKRDERDKVAWLHLRHLLRYVDQPICPAQPRDQPGAVAGELVHSQALRRLPQHPAPELAPPDLAVGEGEQPRQGTAPRLRPRRPTHAPQQRA